jgi:3-deoxy-D-manno-octulosonic-acid transferase
VLKCFTHFFVQNEESKALLASIGINNVDVTGDTRFDRVAAIAKQSRRLPVVETFLSKNPKCFIAGSSWLPDERIFTRYFREHPGWKLIIAPHVIAPLHLEQIRNLMPDLSVKFYTQLTAADREALVNADVLVIDCFGLLSSMYKYGQIAYVGGGFGVGIHNLPEAAVWNMPVIFGPNNLKFQEAQELKACGGGLEIEDYDDFCRIMDSFEADPEKLKAAADAAGDYVRSQSGATEKLLTRLHKRSQKK